MNNPLFADKLLREINCDEEAIKGEELVQNYNRTKIILNGQSDNTLRTLLSPGVVNTPRTIPGKTQELTKKEKIRIVEEALDYDTSKKMMNCDKLAYFEKNKENLLLGASR